MAEKVTMKGLNPVTRTLEMTTVRTETLVFPLVLARRAQMHRVRHATTNAALREPGMFTFHQSQTSPICGAKRIAGCQRHFARLNGVARPRRSIGWIRVAQRNH